MIGRNQLSIVTGLAGSTKPLTGIAIGTMFLETDTANVFEFHGAGGWKQVTTAGADHTLGDLGTGFGIAQNRIDSGITTTRRKMTFLDGTGPTKIKVRFDSTVNTEIAFFVINAISDQHADNELVTPPTRDSGTERYTVFDVSLQPDGLEISSLSPIDRVDYLTDALAGSAILYVEGA